jgi:hypothetical protein
MTRRLAAVIVVALAGAATLGLSILAAVAW